MQGVSSLQKSSLFATMENSGNNQHLPEKNCILSTVKFAYKEPAYK